jgi:hypothetical protein
LTPLKGCPIAQNLPESNAGVSPAARLRGHSFTLWFSWRGTPLQRLQYLAEQAGLSASDLGRLLGNRGMGSLLLTGKRGLSKTHIRTLAQHFKVRADYFL